MTHRHVILTGLLVVGAMSLHAQTIRLAPPARPPVTDADVLVLHEINKATGEPYGTMPARYVTEMRRSLSALLDVAVIDAAYAMAPLYLDRAAAQEVFDGRRRRGSGEGLQAAEATFNSMSLLRVAPAVGRDFTEADVVAGRRLVLITAGAWERLFGRRDNVVGTLVWSADKTGHPLSVGRAAGGDGPISYEIVGVLPPGLMTANPEIEPTIDAFVLAPTRLDDAPVDERWFAPIVRLKSGVALETAQVGIDVAVTSAQRSLGVESPGRTLGARLDTMRAK